MARIDRMQSECGIVWRYNSLWDWPFASQSGVYDAIGFDRLHVCKGLIEKCVVTLNGIILEEGPGGGQANNTLLMNMQAKLDHRIACTPAYLGDDVYVPTLVGGFYARNKVCASLMQFVGCVESQDNFPHLFRRNHGTTLSGCPSSASA